MIGGDGRTEAKVERRRAETISAEELRMEKADRVAFFRRAFKAQYFNRIDGDYLEFGCFGAMTFRTAHAEMTRYPMDRIMWAFDSFAGLPESNLPEDRHPNWEPGHMAMTRDAFIAACAKAGIPDTKIRVVPGFYEATVGRAAPDAANLPRNVALAYIDCDLYSSTATVLQFLAPRLKHGTIVALDDYHCWAPDQIAGERRAFIEYLATETRYRFLPYLPIGWSGMSFVVEDKKLLPDDPLPWRL